ncbi:MAG: hypothetical protein H6667_17740 [Ardenticatenaceae bacterium]|nr:hypothetical protein [Ardenticatenaceae bacterium]
MGRQFVATAKYPTAILAARFRAHEFDEHNAALQEKGLQVLPNNKMPIVVGLPSRSVICFKTVHRWVILALMLPGGQVIADDFLAPNQTGAHRGRRQFQIQLSFCCWPKLRTSSPVNGDSNYRCG